jgi:hypothetical protein
MTNNIQAYPLQWPLARPRTANRQVTYAFRQQRTRARHTVGKGVDNIYHELRLMGATDVVISSNIPLRRDGTPRSGEAQPHDPGVAVYFNYDKAPVCLACDQWTHVEDNLWSIYLTLEAMRGIDRWGAAKLAATFTGYAALPPPTATAPWSDVLGVDRYAPWDDVRDVYLAQVKLHHPDNGGDPDKFRAVQTAYEQAKQERGK